MGSMTRRSAVAVTLAIGVIALIATYSRFQRDVKVVVTTERLWVRELEKYSFNRQGAVVVVIQGNETSVTSDYWEDGFVVLNEYERFLSGRGAKVTAAYIRNPGGLHLLIEGTKSPLGFGALQRICDFAKGRGDRVNPHIQVVRRVGQDGTTPIVVANAYPKKGFSERGVLEPPVTDVSTSLHFKNPSDAKHAASYIDNNAYTITLKEMKPHGPTMLTARLNNVIPYYDYNSEWDAFQIVAERFGGKVEAISVKWPPNVGIAHAND